MAGPVSVKHLEIDKFRSNVTVVTTVAVVITIFCLMSTKALLGQASYQKRVISARHAGLKQLEDNVDAAKSLKTQYNEVFEGSAPINIIGGQNDKSSSVVPPNGDNARIVLDALPSKYDFPALLTSVNYILSRNGVTSGAITGTDDSATTENEAQTKPQPVAIQLSVSGTAPYASVQSLVHDFERSIRPFDINNVQLSGPQNSISFTLAMTTYYQPSKSLDLTTKAIK